MVGCSANAETGVLVVTYGQTRQLDAQLDALKERKDLVLSAFIEATAHVGCHAKTDAKHRHSQPTGMGLGEEEYQH